VPFGSTDFPSDLGLIGSISSFSLVESLRLAGCRQHRVPPTTGRIEALYMVDEQFDRHMNEALVLITWLPLAVLAII
jgi:hypothetical protein